MGAGRRLRAPAGGAGGSRAELAAWLGRAARGAPLGRLEEAADGVCFLLVLDALTGAPEVGGGGGRGLLARANFRCGDADDRLRNLRLFDGALAASLPEGSPRRPSPDWELLALGNAREVLGLARWVRALALQNDPGGRRLSAYDGRARVLEALRAQAGRDAGGASEGAPPGKGGALARVQGQLLRSFLERLEEDLLLRLGKFEGGVAGAGAARARRDGLRARLEALEGCCLDSAGGGVGEGLAREMLAVLRRPMEVPATEGGGELNRKT